MDTKKKILEDNLDKIKDKHIKKLFTEFYRISDIEFKKLTTPYDNYERYGLLAKKIRYMKFFDIEWEYFCKIVQKEKSIVKEVLYFLIFLIKTNNYFGGYKEYIELLIPYMSNIMIKRSTLIKIFQVNKTPIHFMVYRRSDYGIKSTAYSSYVIDLNTNNIFLRNILLEFISSAPNSNIQFYKSFPYFEESLPMKNINSIKDFNIKTFRTQFKNYSNRYGKKGLIFLVRFYIFLLSQYNDEQFFKETDELDINILKRSDFIKIYKDGFVKVYYNPYESYPDADKWILVPNGFERISTQINSDDYKAIDFSKIEDERYRRYAKEWFWDKGENSINSKIRSLANIKIFTNFIYKLKRDKKIKTLENDKFNENRITQIEIILFKEYLKSQKDNFKTIQIYLISIRSFLDYITKKGYVEVDAGISYLLKSKREKVVNQYDKQVPEEHIVLLEKKLKENAKNNYTYALYYALFHISISSEFRISQIINLKTDDIQEGMKKNEYIIKTTTKVSNGDVVDQPIGIRTKRFLDQVIKFTEEMRKNCNNKELSKFIFINKKMRNINSVIKARSYYTYLTDCCASINIPKYTSKNFRCTYLSHVKKVADKNLWSELELINITNHKDVEILEKHYLGNQIRECLEASYGIIIGDLEIKGQVVDNINTHKISENIVEDGCGVCSRESCNIESSLGCLLCKSFIATLNNIPYFEMKIEQINKQIEGENIQHEKEHLQTIKRLFVAYLERLYIVKEGKMYES